MRLFTSSSMDPGIPMFRPNLIFPAPSKNLFIRNLSSPSAGVFNLGREEPPDADP